MTVGLSQKKLCYISPQNLANKYNIAYLSTNPIFGRFCTISEEFSSHQLNSIFGTLVGILKSMNFNFHIRLCIPNLEYSSLQHKDFLTFSLYCSQILAQKEILQKILHFQSTSNCRVLWPCKINNEENWIECGRCGNQTLCLKIEELLSFLQVEKCDTEN